MNSDIEGAFSIGSGTLSDAFLDRLVRAYAEAQETWSSDHSDLWRSIIAKSALIDGALRDPAISFAMLRALLLNPRDHYLLYGIEQTFRDEVDALQNSEALRRARVAEIASMLAELCEALGVGRRFNPVFGAANPSLALNPPTIPAMLNGIEQAIGSLGFNNPFPCEHGVPTMRGIISHNAIRAVYTAWRTAGLTRRFGPTVLEIGAGMGRSAVHCVRMGVTDYTIVDFPLANMIQAIFVANALGEAMVTLTGEEPKPGCIAIVSPSFLAGLGRRHDLFVSFNSFTELTRNAAERYGVLAASQRAAFFSINHEANAFTVNEILRPHARCDSRSIAWLLQGYVEELFVPEAD